MWQAAMAALHRHRCGWRVFEVELAACKTLAVMELIIRLGKRPIKHNLDGFRASCAGVGSSHPGLDSIDRNPKLVPLPALPTIGGSLLPGTCDDEYSTCWPPACQLQRTALPLLPGSPPHSSGGASHGQRSRLVVRVLSRGARATRRVRRQIVAYDGPRRPRCRRRATIACKRISDKWTLSS